MTVLTTPRLRLEPMTDDHLDGLNALNSDPEVMRYLSGQPETRDETMAIIERVKGRWRELGYSWWTIFDRATDAIVGAGAIQNLRRDAAPLPDPGCPLEIGWRLRRDAWGRGLATEAALAMGDFAFDTLHATELLAVCHPDNTASSSVMARLGMRDEGLQRWYGKALATWRIDAAVWRANVANRRASSAR